jgi:hypothetical protein
LRERQIGIGPFDPGDERDEALAADFSAGGLMEKPGLDQALGDEAFDRALQALDGPLRQGSSAGAIALGVEHAHDVPPAMIRAHLPDDRQPMFGCSIDALEIVRRLGVDDALDGVAIAGAEFWIAADAAALLGGAQAVFGALLDQGALQFRHGAENLQGEAALWGRRVDRIGERFEMRALGVELGDHGKEMRQRTGQTVEPRDDQHVAAAHPRQRLGQFWPEAFAPDICSRKISTQPAAFSTSVWASVTWSSVQTRA